jgi:hypothetical protein
MSVHAPSRSKYLSIYLNDHLGGSTTGLELVRRIAAEHAGTKLGATAAVLAREIEEDRDTLLEVMDRVGASKDQAKVALGWISEKAHRLKPNRELRGASPLTPLIDLETLSLGIEGKRTLWVGLAEVDEVAEAIGRDRLAQLAERAADQRDRVEVHRRAAAREAFTAG